MTYANETTAARIDLPMEEVEPTLKRLNMMARFIFRIRASLPANPRRRRDVGLHQATPDPRNEASALMGGNGIHF